jgi:AraC-like DNA-binding protein
MPASEVRAFTDPDAFHAAFHRTTTQGVVTTPGNFHAELTRVDFYRLWMSRCNESLPRILNIAPTPMERAVIIFPTDERQPALRVSGMALSSGQIITWCSTAPIHHLTAAACRWGSMSLTCEDVAGFTETILGRELTLPTFLGCIRPAAPLLSRLSNLRDAAGHLARTAPDILAQSEVARAMEQALLHATFLCLGGGETATRGSHHRHAVIMRRLEALFEANPDRTLYLTELCAAVRASDRTLRACCQEYLGMSPTRYLWLRRMHLARRALRTADPAMATVTGIATNHGFWELGRFSVAYRALFAEPPLATLRQPPADPVPLNCTASPWRLPGSA